MCVFVRVAWSNCSLDVIRKTAVLSVCGRSAAQKCGNDAIGPAGEVINLDHDNLYDCLGNGIIKAGGRPLRKRGGWAKLLFIISFLMFPAVAIAQEEGVDSSSECAEVLAAPPFVDILTRNEGKDFHGLSSVKNGRALLGLECSVDELTEFFESAGWEFRSYEKWSLRGPWGYDGIPEFYNDSAARFCLKRPTLFGMFGFRCRPLASVYFHEGRIVYIQTSMNK